MVRKRSRKYYESDENDSDSDYCLESPPASPAPKKYSLRQRKRPLFIEDFDYNDEGEEIAPAAPSDDEEYQVELDLKENETSEYIDNSTFVNSIEPEAEAMPDDGLIDFEDMIRADVVVNKNRIDYDNVIHKTEIKVQPIGNKPTPGNKGNKRGRKPKAKQEIMEENLDENLSENVLEPHTTIEESDEHILHSNGSIDPSSMLQTELKEDVDPQENTDPSSLLEPEVSVDENPIPLSMVQSELEESEKETRSIDHVIDKHNENGIEEKIKKPDQDNSEVITKTEESPTDSQCKMQEPEIKLNDEDLLSNNFERIEKKLLGQPYEEEEQTIEEEIEENEEKEAILEDSDDVILVEDEKDAEVIVLDDD